MARAYTKKYKVVKMEGGYHGVHDLAEISIKPPLDKAGPLEKPSSVPFPSWMERAWHNCLVGCMLCQRACPENRHVLDWVEGDEVFTEDETALLMAGSTRETLPAATIVKLERADLLGDLAILPRNLDVLLNP